MKITTQRQILWIVNFFLVIGLLGFVFLMSKHGGKARTKELRSYVKKVETAIQGVKLKTTNEGPGTNRQKLKTFLDPKFAFQGYIPPKKKPTDTKGPVVKKAPPLNSLIEVSVVLASRDSKAQGTSGPDAVEAGAFIKIKSIKTDQFSTYWYRVGETIGEGHSARADEDKTLQQWGPCVLLAVSPTGITCSWNKESEEATVDIELLPDPDKVWVQGTVNGKKFQIGNEGSINNKEDHGKGVITPGLVGLSLFKPGKNKAGDSIVEFTQDGIDLFDRGDGEKLLDDLKTKPMKDGNGLKVTSIPPRLREFGLREGDVVIRVDNQPVKSKSSVTNYVRKNYKTRKEFRVTVIRENRERTIGVRVPKKTSGIQGKTKGIKFGQ